MSVSVKLHLGDCLEFMKSMPDKSVDAVITDPPYGNNTAYRSYNDTRANLEQLTTAFVPQALRLAEKTFITCGVANMWLYPEPTWTMCWVNQAGIGSSSWGFTCWQPILAYGKDPYLQDRMGRRPDTYFQKTTDKSKADHPVEKPANFMRWLIERTTRVGDTVFDPFMGSGTTGVACVQTGRNFIGCELDPEYFAIAEKRIADAQLQTRMNI